MEEKKIKCSVCGHEWNVQFDERRKYYVCPHCRAVFGTAQHPLSELFADRKAKEKVAE